MEAKPLIKLLQRANKSRYDQFLMHNRMLMNCYTVDEDSDIGMHYILHIPDTDEYVGSFYDETLFLDVKMISTAYSNGHAKLNEAKKGSKEKVKPKELREELHFRAEHDHAILKFLFYLRDELVDVETLSLDYPITTTNPVAKVIEDTYGAMISRVKPGGICLQFDGNKLNLYELAVARPEIYFFDVKLNGKRIRIPLYKSLFLNMKSFDEFFISLQETRLVGIYLYTVQLSVNGLTDQQVGYIQNF